MKFTRHVAPAIVYSGIRMSRRGNSQPRRWYGSAMGMPALLAMLVASLLTACLDEVALPQCLLEGTCQSGAGGAEGGSTSGIVGGALGMVGAGQPGESIGGEPAVAGQGGQSETPPDPCGCTVVPGYLAPACAGRPYQATLTVSSGQPPYSWKLAPQPEGWTIAVSPENPEVAILHATKAPDEATELTLIVTDARNAQRTLTLSLEVRSACWLAYPSLETQGPELRLVDPLAETPPPEPLAHAQGAYDFQFSPDGAFLAYRYGVDDEHPRGRHLSLVDLGSLKEHPISFGEDQVVSYAWAPNSGTLAAAFAEGGETYLGAIRPAAAGSDDSPSSLASTRASIESELYWVGSEYVSFHAPNGLGDQRLAYFSELSGGGFSAPEEVIRSFDAEPTVLPTETGFFLITPFQTLYVDLSDGVQVLVDHWDIGLVAPSGRYSALLAADGLPQLLPAATADYGPIAEATDGSQICTQLLAWAPDRERLACVADVSNGDGSSHGEIRIFDLNLAPFGLDAMTLQGFCPGDLNDTSEDSCLVKKQGYSFGSSQAAGSARAFSPSGRYFAFARALPDQVYVYLADLDAAPQHVGSPRIFPVDDTEPSPLAFAFSPDERFLLVRRGPRLSVIELATGATQRVAHNLADAAPCSDDFLAGPNLYCGNTKQLAAPQWAGDSHAAGFWTSDGLTISDLSPFPSKSEKVLPAAACAAQCSGQFGFQP